MASRRLPPDENSGPTILGVIWAFTILDIFIVALRFYDRVHLRGGLGWDDWTILAACAVTTFGSACNAVMVANGWGRHIEYLNDRQLSKGFEWVTFAELQSYIAVYLVKLSVCLFILRLLSGSPSRVIRWLIHALMVFLTIITIVVVVFLCVSCIPFKGIWHPEPSFHKKCLSKHIQTSVTRAFGIVGIVTDFACVLIPIWVIRKLHMNLRTKVMISLILALGLFTAACSIGKTVTAIFASDDATWEYTPVLIWASLEANLGILVASMPALRQLFSDFLHSSPKSQSNTRDTYGHTLVSFGTGRCANKTAKNTMKDADSDIDLLVHDGVVQTRSFAVESGSAKDASPESLIVPRNLRLPEHRV